MLGKENKLKTVLCLRAGDDACSLYRIREPYETIVSDNIRFIVSNRLEDAWLSEDDNDTVDAILMQRPTNKLHLQFIKDAKADNILTVVETDDDLLHIPSSNPVFGFMQEVGARIYSECLKECDYIHVSTPELMIGKKSVVFPNAINLKKYNQPLPQTHQISWQGSPTHSDSLQLIKPVILDLVKNGVSVLLRSNKQWLEEMFPYHANLTLEEYVPLDLYYLMPSQAKISLTPLPCNVFNSKKSELKILEAAAWGLPSVSSDVAPYRRFYEESGGANILVRKEKPMYWLKSIYSLLENPYLYDEQAAKSKAAVQFKYNLSLVNRERALWWTKILS